MPADLPLPAMAASASDPTMDRIAALEKRVRELHTRIAALERKLSDSTSEHPNDQATVRRKVVYDWQDETPRT